LWAAGVLGVLAIAIAVLIVLNAKDRKDRESPPPTVTNTITESSPKALPAPGIELPPVAVEPAAGGPPEVVTRSTSPPSELTST
jgi:serine/threonine-protein kinase